MEKHRKAQAGRPAPAEPERAAGPAAPPAEPERARQPAGPPDAQLRSWRTLFRWSLTAFAMWLVFWMLQRTGSSLAPFVIGLVMAYLMLPLVSLLERRMKRWIAITLIYAVGLGAVIGAVVFIVPATATQIGEFGASLPGFYDNTVQPQIDSWLTWYRRDVPPDVQTQIDQQVNNAVTGLRENASAYAQRIGSTLLTGLTSIFRTVLFLAGFFIVPFWLFYVLLDADAGKAVVDRMLPPKARPDFWAVTSIFDRIFSAYIRGQITLGLIVAVMSYAGLWIVDLAFGSRIDIPYKLLLSLIAGFTELIPVVGPILGAIPAIIVGLITSPLAGLVIAGLYVLIQQVENNVLVPRIIGGVVELHASVLMILLVVSGSVAGLLGVILSAPLAAIARDVYRYVNGRLRASEDPLFLPAGALPIRASEIDSLD